MLSRDCRGVVFEPPCPDTYVTDNVIVGNLLVRADPSFGGGQLSVSGSTTVDDQVVNYQLVLNSSDFYVESGGQIQMTAGDINEFNAVGGGVSIFSGSGLSPTGGSGGNIDIRAGAGFGEEEYGSVSGVGGSILLTAGAAKEGSGGGIIIKAGSSELGPGGSVSISAGESLTGDSGALDVLTSPSQKDSGTIMLSTGASSRNSGNVLINTGDSGDKAGSIQMVAGTSSSHMGSNVMISAGSSLSSAGGVVTIKSGSGANESTSGSVLVQTEHASTIGDTGSISLRSGEAQSGTSGSILLATGNADDDGKVGLQFFVVSSLPSISSQILSTCTISSIAGW